MGGVFPVGHDAHGDVGVHLDGSGGAAQHHGGAVAGVAVGESAGAEVEDTDEEGDEEGVLVHLRHGVVHLRHDFAGVVDAGGDRTEEAAGDGHDEGGRYAFAADVADAEEGFVVAHIEVVEVTPHLLGRGQGAVEGQLVEVGVGGEGLGKHAVLDVAGDAQLAADALFLSADTFQAFEAFDGAPHDVDHEAEAE